MHTHLHSADADIARVADRDRVAAVISLGFSTDPVARWMYPDSHQFMTGFPTFVLAMGGRAFDHGSAYCTADLSGAALWLPPGVRADEDAMGQHLERTVDPAKLEAVQAVMVQMEGHHPVEPHWYLPLIGVDPARQRSGHGAALMRCALERVDRDGLPAYSSRRTRETSRSTSAMASRSWRPSRSATCPRSSRWYVAPARTSA